MKKKLAALLAVAMLASTMLAGCGAEKQDDPVEPASSEAIVSEPASEPASAEDVTESSEPAPETANSDYLSWTSKEYSAASDEEKTEAVIAFTIYTSNAMGLEITEEMFRASLSDETVKSQLDSTKAQIETSLKTIPDTSLKEIADLGISALQSNSDTE